MATILDSAEKPLIKKEEIDRLDKKARPKYTLSTRILSIKTKEIKNKGIKNEKTNNKTEVY